jgi:thiamine biosynthesis lipoprotein
VTPPVFALLQHAQRLHAETNGAFDVTIAPLVNCWGFMGGTGKMPQPEAVAAARQLVGMQNVELNAAEFTVRFAREGMMIDLGAIGKGYAVEQAAEILREAGVLSALLHGGTSTVQAIGHPPDADAWNVALPHRFAPPGADADVLTMLPLKNEAMSVSAIWGRSFQAGGKSFGHVLDPRTGEPVSNAVMAVVILPSATETDALSTALLTLGAGSLDAITNLRPGMKTLLLAEAGSSNVETRGIPFP